MRNLYISRLMGKMLYTESIMGLFSIGVPFWCYENWKIWHGYTTKQCEQKQRASNDSRHAVSAIYGVHAGSNNGVVGALLIHS